MKKLQHNMGSDGSPIGADDRKTWLYAFAILVLVSGWMAAMRLSGNPFLALDFEATVVYLPTIVAGVIVGTMALKRTRA